ncbi:MAG: NlpC/P60 family protein [Gemmatimonadetes bacterium]|jgi:cell wall-associated NlpC family hydrolase|nr:NlpC/P60 family protein [Gemmatimonadota bacterium]
MDFMTFSATTTLRHRVLRSLSGCALVLTCARSAGAQAQLEAKPEAIDAAKPFAAWSASVHNVRDSLVSVARAQVGTKYVRGGNSPEAGFDCSGLVRYVMAALKVNLPRTARQQATQGLAVVRDTTRLRPGDLLTFGKGKRGQVSHIGIYIGGGKYVHASSVAGRVIESDIGRTSSPLIKAWRGVRRVVSGSAADSTRNGDG